ncbi:EAL domain-containing protein [Noviherbaspirillum pedocola]|uniref:EAL domain-containing protein n=1 Tax=Noviherbaspirillum pedocola TaxID=2801341 RepID=UPI001F3B67EE|nr:EAL domain-containing protein [Noviherbaspirillum pedocola]
MLKREATYRSMADNSVEALNRSQKSEERFVHLTTHSSDWYWETDESDRFTFLPNGKQRPSGLPPAQLIGKRRIDLAVDPNAPALREYLRKVERREAFENLRYRTQGSTPGTTRVVNISGAPFFEHGVFRGYRGTGRDVTDEVERTNELARLARENTAIIENSPDIMAVLDEDGNYLRISEAAFEILGYGAREFLGRHFLEFIHPDDAAIGSEALSGCKRHKRFASEFEARWNQRRGGIVHLSTFLRWSAAENLLYLTSRDITERCNAQAALKQSRDEIASMLESIGDAFFAIDKHWRIKYVNSKAANLAGADREDALGKTLWEVVPQIRNSPTADFYRRAMENRQPVFFEAYSPVVKAWIEVRAYPNADGLLVSFYDISARRVAELAVRQSESRLRDVIQLTPAGYLRCAADSCIVDVNIALCQIAGYAREDLVGQPLDQLFPGCPWQEALFGRHSDDVAHALEVAIHHQDGHEVPVLFNGRIERDGDGRALSFTAFLTDITNRKQSEMHMQHLATHDSLTGLPNRAYLHAHVEGMLGRDGASVPFAVMFIDLDRFKEVNDSFGHEAGDLLLREVARRLRTPLREEDLMVRLGGDEFVIVVPCEAPREAGAAVARALLDSLAEPVNIAGHELHVTASIGISVFPDDGHGKELLFQNADTAMYRAKAARRNAYRFFEPDMSVQVKTRMTLDVALRHALRRNEFALHFQPRINLQTLEISGMEALLRWKHPEFGTVPPAEFIGIAEESGLIETIGMWALEEACMQGAALMRRLGRPLRISVNVSARQLQAPDFADRVSAALRAGAMDAQLLELELTESTLIEDLDRSASLLKELKALGVAIAVDDFGTGYSNLAYLRRFPLDVLKLDRSFLVQQDEGISNVAFIKAFVDMAHALGLAVVAEGVESPEVLEFLCRTACDEGQGYLFAEPMPVDAVEAYLSAWLAGALPAPAALL